MMSRLPLLGGIILCCVTAGVAAPPKPKPISKTPTKVAKVNTTVATKPLASRGGKTFVRATPTKTVVTVKTVVPTNKPVVAKSAVKSAPVATLASKPKTTPAPLTQWETAMVEVVGSGKGRINYEIGVVKAVGFGALRPPTLKKSRSQDTLEAREAAVADALRNLGMTVKQVRVDAESRVSNYVLQSDEVRVRVEAVIQNATVVEETFDPTAGVFRVVVQVPLTGAGSVEEAVRIAEKIGGSKNVPPDPYAPGAPPPPGVNYTGLIIDCRGYGVTACMSPKLYDEHGGEVYGTVKVSEDYVNEVGIVAYPGSMEEARGEKSRAGERPLIVRARGRADAYGYNVVISEADARRIREANEKDKFLERTAVVFIINRR